MVSQIRYLLGAIFIRKKLKATGLRSLDRPTKLDSVTALTESARPWLADDTKDQVQHNCNVDEEHNNTDEVRAVDSLVDFEWNQGSSDDDCEPLGPALPQPEASALRKK
jgi:hypothetical protein